MSHLYDDGATEVACWSHARSYVFKALRSEPEVASELLGNLRVMFLLERQFADKPRKQRERMRKAKVKVVVDRHFDLCRKHEAAALDGTPLAAAIRYSLNQEQALRRFLEDGRLPATNNISERQLRRQANGRKAWLFVGSSDGAEVNTTFSTRRPRSVRLPWMLAIGSSKVDNGAVGAGSISKPARRTT